MEEYNRIICKTKYNDTDDKGIVTVAVNGIGIKDSQGDISAKGSFNKTLKENFKRCKWFLNHDITQLLGVPIEGKEENGNLVMIGKINLNKQIGRETFEDYKLYAEYGKTLEHSVGVRAIKRDENNKSVVLEWFLGEYSTLTSWGANPQTFLMDIKGLDNNGLKAHIDIMRKALNMRYSDEKLKNLENNLSFIEKAIMGENIVKCSHCGLIFDYDSVPERTFSDQVIESVANYARWIQEDVVREEMEKLKPEIRESVLNIINQNKSVEDLTSYVNCPKCYSRIYRSHKLIEEEPSNDTLDKSRQKGTFDLEKIGKALLNN